MFDFSNTYRKKYYWQALFLGVHPNIYSTSSTVLGLDVDLLYGQEEVAFNLQRLKQV